MSSLGFFMQAELFTKLASYNKRFDRARVQLAFDFVNEKYHDTEGSIAYPLEVLHVLLPLRPDEDMVIAVLLHDLYILSFLNDQTVRDLFGHEVWSLLVSLKRLIGLNYGENERSSQVEILRKMFLTMAKDLRVILIWLAQRLCRMHNLENFPESGNRLRVAKETMDVYVPIASRLGIYRLKTQLEDLSFKYLNPVEYSRINEEIKKFGELRKVAIDSMTEDLRNFLYSKGFKAEIFGRLKSVYSIYNKVKRKGVHSAEDLYDLFAMRIILPVEQNMDHLYTVLGLIHSQWKPISHRFKDYVAVPKPNGYRSLHTVVLGLSPKGMNQPVEIQIRDEDMHRESEFGVASHWLYKTSRGSKANLHSHVEWLRALEHIHDFFDSDSDVIKSVAVDIFKDRIFVLTPRGEVKDLPIGAVPLDFAYAVHTDVGNKCVGAKVNGNAVPLDYQLKNGEVVEILTKKEATPKLKWISMVNTGFAKHKIKAWFANQNREKGPKEEKELLPKKQEHKSEKEKQSVPSMKKELLESQLLVAGESYLPLKMASCCEPRLGDKVLGYVTRAGKISIHKNSCKLLDGLNRERIIFAQWRKAIEASAKDRFQIGVKLKVLSRVGLIKDLSSVISGLGINILDVIIRKTGQGLYYDYFLLELDNSDKVDLLLDGLERVRGVLKVVREDKFRA